MYSRLRLECVLSFQKEGAVGIIPCQDKHEAYFEYVDVAEGHLTTQERELHCESVDTLMIKEEASTEEKTEMFPENITALSIKEDQPFTQEPRDCFENVDTLGQKEYRMCLSIVSVTSIKEEPADDVNITPEPLAIGENESVDALSAKKAQGMKQEEYNTCFTNTTQMKEGEVENITIQPARIANSTYYENENTAHIKEEQFEIQENKSFIPVEGNQFTTQGTGMCSMNIDLESIIGEQLTDECSATTVKVKEEEITFPEQEDTETDEVFRLVHCLYLVYISIVIHKKQFITYKPSFIFGN
jgi:hypothetical protein